MCQTKDALEVATIQGTKFAVTEPNATWSTMLVVTVPAATNSLVLADKDTDQEPLDLPITGTATEKFLMFALKLNN